MTVETEELIREWEEEQEALKDRQRQEMERLAAARAAREREAQEALELAKAAEAEEVCGAACVAVGCGGVPCVWCCGACWLLER